MRASAHLALIKALDFVPVISGSHNDDHHPLPVSGQRRVVPRAVDHERGYPSHVFERIGRVESLDGLHHRAEIAADPLRPLGGILAQVGRQADRGGVAEGGRLRDGGAGAGVGRGIGPEFTAFLPGLEAGEPILEPAGLLGRPSVQLGVRSRAPVRRA